MNAEDRIAAPFETGARCELAPRPRHINRRGPTLELT